MILNGDGAGQLDVAGIDFHVVSEENAGGAVDVLGAVETASMAETEPER